MQISRSGFTLIEILIAGAVLGAVVFAVLRMSTNNAHQVSLLELEQSRQRVAIAIEQCIRSLGFDDIAMYPTETGSISFGADQMSCLTGTTETGIILKNYSGDTDMAPTEITNFFTISTGSLYHSITLTTSTEKNSQTREFRIYK